MKIYLRLASILLNAWALMIAFGIRINLSQQLIDKGEKLPELVTKDYGQVNGGERVLVCSYFTGVRIVTTVFWYSPNNIMGKDSCPIWTGSK